MHRSMVVVLVAQLLSSASASADVLTVQCDAPKGVRLMGVGSPGPHDDAYRAATPRFVIDTDRPEEAVVSFSNPDEGKTLRALTIGNRLVVFQQMAKENWTYMLYPVNGVGIFTRVGEMDLVSLPFGAVYRSACKFSVEKSEPLTFEMQ